MAVAMGKQTSRPPLARELGLGLAVFAVYVLVSSMDWPGRRAAAEVHGRALLHLEQALHLDPERALNSWLAPHATLRVLANYEYATTYVISSFVLIFWVWARRPAAYRWARTSFVLLNLAALVCFAAWPCMPPRLLPGSGFVDTVLLGHTWFSWGSPLVAHANQLAAMPSLHIGWAMWVSAVLALVAGGRVVQAVSAAHVVLTLLVILATGNHYLLDAVGGALLVWVALAVTSRFVPNTPPGSAGSRVPAPDLFFLRVETPDAPQHVGGVVLIDTRDRGPDAPSRGEIEGVLLRALQNLPRWRQRLSTDSLWRRPRWIDCWADGSDDTEPDLAEHLEVVDVRRPDGSLGGTAALDALVSELAATPLPRDRPLWRVVLVHGMAADRAAVVLLVHHVVVDGLGAVAQTLTFLEPLGDTPPPEPPPLPRPPGPLVRAAAVVAGLAQLAADGPARARLPRHGPGGRSFARLDVPIPEIREIARMHGVRVTDVLLTAVAGAVSRTVPGARGRDLRAAVPLLVRPPDPRSAGNGTAAVMVDLPLGEDDAARLAEVARRTGRLRTPTRVLASRFVQAGVGELLPARLHATFARTVYGPSFVTAVVSNMPGPATPLGVVGLPLSRAYPLLPVAPRTALAVGALGWAGQLCLGITTDPAVVPAHQLAAAARAVIDELRGERAEAAAQTDETDETDETGQADQAGRDQASASISLERA